METKHTLDLDTNETLVDATKYQSMIGSLMYLTLSKSDIVHATYLCARYQAQPTEKHLKEVKRICRYLQGTVNMGLWYTKYSGFELIGFLDADHAGCHDTFKKQVRTMMMFLINLAWIQGSYDEGKAIGKGLKLESKDLKLPKLRPLIDVYVVSSSNEESECLSYKEASEDDDDDALDKLRLDSRLLKCIEMGRNGCLAKLIRYMLLGHLDYAGELFSETENSQGVLNDSSNILTAFSNGIMATMNWRDIPDDTPIDRLEVLRTFRVILFSIFNDEWKSFQSQHQIALRLLASFQDDAKYEHVGQDTRSQDGKDFKEKALKISELTSKSRLKTKNSGYQRSKITSMQKELQRNSQDTRFQDLRRHRNEAIGAMTTPYGETVNLRFGPKAHLNTEPDPWKRNKKPMR
nr:uncharacterized mitochondrial protein AtMg00810-like [Tanacetum cinerariifolium]